MHTSVLTATVLHDLIPTVYVVDNDEMTRNYFDAVLSEAHLTSCRLESASLFLEIYDPYQPGCVLLDIEMPGMTGIALQQKLNLCGAVIPLIFVTGRPEVSGPNRRSVSESPIKVVNCWVKSCRNSQLACR